MTQDGAYTRLLDAYYSAEKPLPTDRETLYAMVRANTEQDRMAVEFVLTHFFRKTRYGFTNRRAKKEFLRAKEISVKRANAGKQRAKQAANAGHLLRNPDSRLQTPDKDIEPKVKSVSALPGFERFYAEYPRKVDPNRARAAWQKIQFLEQHADEVMAGLAKWMVCPQWQDRQFIPHPATFIHNRRWESEPPMENANGTASKNNSRARNAIDSERTTEARREGVVL